MRRREHLWTEEAALRAARIREALNREPPRYPPSTEEAMHRLRKRIEFESHEAMQMLRQAGLPEK